MKGSKKSIIDYYIKLEDYDLSEYIYWQECVEDYSDYYYEYYYENGVRLCRTDDKNKIRQDKIDKILDTNEPYLQKILNEKRIES